MKKTIIIAVSFMLLIAAGIGAAYTIDMNRIKNNKPVIFSTWGFDYAPPEKETEEVEDVVCQSFTKYKPSFVGEVLEETTTYMLVEPIRRKADEPFIPEGDKIKIEYASEHCDYSYGIGRKVVIYYEGEPEIGNEGETVIKTDDISVDGFREFKLSVTPSDVKEKRQIVSRTSPTDSSGKWWIYGDSVLYYYGIEDVEITVKGWSGPLDAWLEDGRITLNGIIAKCNQDVSDGVIEEMIYKDGGSQVYKYPEYTIIKYHTLDGNRDVYIGSTDMDIEIRHE